MRKRWHIAARPLLYGAAGTLAGGTVLMMLMAGSGAAPAPPGLHTGGSGFAIAPALVVTNAHLVLRCRDAGLPIRESAHSGEWRVLHEEPDMDLALLEGPPDVTLPTLRLSAVRHLASGTPVLLLGHPGGAPGARPVATRGRVAGETLTIHEPGSGRAASLRTTDADGREILPTWEDGIAWVGRDRADRLRWVVQIAAATGPGDSGGPAVDGVGAVVGVVFAGGPQGPTLTVPLADLAGFLVRAGVLPGFAPPGTGAADWAGAYGVAAGSVVRLAC